jgi:hypothetical protein
VIFVFSPVAGGADWLTYVVVNLICFFKRGLKVSINCFVVRIFLVEKMLHFPMKKAQRI